MEELKIKTPEIDHEKIVEEQASFEKKDVLEGGDGLENIENIDPDFPIEGGETKNYKELLKESVKKYKKNKTDVAIKERVGSIRKFLGI